MGGEEGVGGGVGGGGGLGWVWHLWMDVAIGRLAHRFVNPLSHPLDTPADLLLRLLDSAVLLVMRVMSMMPLLPRTPVRVVNMLLQD